MRCQQNVGFLLPRECGNEAIQQCPVCQRWICPEHTVVLPDGTSACASDAADRNVGPLVERDRMWDYYGYGYGYGPTIVYTNQDYSAFDQGAPDQGMAEQLTES